MKIEATSDNGAAAVAQPTSSQISVPEEKIEKAVGLSIDEKNIGDKRRCPGCEAKGAILCAICSGSGSGSYFDSIMESQGIIVKVRCLGCGGTGNMMCSECGGRVHSGVA